LTRLWVEIDKINKRSKNAEIAFLNLYKGASLSTSFLVMDSNPKNTYWTNPIILIPLVIVFADVPDPAQSFRAALEAREKMSELDALLEENRQLKQEILEAKDAVSQSAASQATVKELQDQIASYEASVHPTDD